LIGLLRPTAGSIHFGAEDYTTANEARRAEIGRRFGVLFQNSALWSSLTAAQNGALPLQIVKSLGTLTHVERKL
jgi:phospholipid/cholesterol/gamma-HCH transport system ATP-binding protein